MSKRYTGPVSLKEVEQLIADRLADEKHNRVVIVKPAKPAPPMSNKELITKLLWLFESSRFEKWYGMGGQFDRYISGEMKFEDDLEHAECVKIVRAGIANLLGIEDKD